MDADAGVGVDESALDSSIPDDKYLDQINTSAFKRNVNKTPLLLPLPNGSWMDPEDPHVLLSREQAVQRVRAKRMKLARDKERKKAEKTARTCLLYTSDAADE